MLLEGWFWKLIVGWFIISAVLDYIIDKEV